VCVGGGVGGIGVEGTRIKTDTHRGHSMAGGTSGGSVGKSERERTKTCVCVCMLVDVWQVFVNSIMYDGKWVGRQSCERVGLFFSRNCRRAKARVHDCGGEGRVGRS
jgi:hypothetical protein